MTLQLPNFFIIGAAKAGTTALYDMLAQHPDIYMSPVKEPRFFATVGEPPLYPGPAGDFLRRVTVWRPRDYAMLFTGVASQRAIGEASAIYIRLPLAAQRIQQTLPQSRLIAILRQPAERAYSNYTFMRQHNLEPETSFEAALAQEEARAQAGWYPGIYYKKNGYYHAQLSVYYALFPHAQIKVVLNEDLRDAPQALLRDLFRFLEVDENFAPEIRRSNVTLLPKNRRLHRLATHPAQLDGRALFLPAFVRRAILSALQRVDSKFNLAPPPPLGPDTRARLTEDYREDILKLQDLIGRDLSHWLAAPRDEANQ
jgi:hypothetical protein